MIRTAIKFIRFDRPKSIGIIVGIVISSFLVGQQLGTLRFITTVMSSLIDNANPKAGEIWVIDNTTRNANNLSKIDVRLVNEIKSIQGVETTYPIVVTNVSVTLPNGKSTPVTLIGSEAPFFAGGPVSGKIIDGNLSSLAEANSVSAEFYSANSLKVNLDIGTPLEINGKNATIKVKTLFAQAFGGHNMYTNIENARFYGNFPNDKVSIVSVKLLPGQDINTVIQEINSTFHGVRAWEINDLKNTTVGELLTSTNMGVSFGALIGFALISGFFIIGLTLYSAVLDRLKDYGTFKAIGATNGYVRKLILTQAIIFAIIGFSIAYVLLLFFKQGMAKAGLIVQITPGFTLFLLAVTLFISVGGSLFAIGKINKLEPASVFK